MMSSSKLLGSLLLAFLALALGCSGGGGSGGGGDSLLAIGDAPVIGTHLEQSAIENGQVPIEDVLEHGRLLFAASFNTLDGGARPETTGAGMPRPRRDPPQNFNRISGDDSNSCAGCHGIPRAGGGGDNVANVFVLAQALPFVNFDGLEGDGLQDRDLDTVGNERNTLGMFGSGYVELLAREMTVALQAIRAQAVAMATGGGQPVTLPLAAKGVGFGAITANPDGSVVTSAVEGVDASLVVKPFHQKGVVVSLREFTNNAMNHHHGMQSAERFGAGVDADNDGRVDELGPGDITAATLWQAALAPPGRVLPGDPAALAAVNQGEALFNAPIGQGGIGCASCHVPFLELDDPVFTEPSPFNPAGNLRPEDVGAPVAFDLTTEGEAPRLVREANGKVHVPAYTDLKRHDMGPAMAEPLVQAMVPGNLFITKKLWGFYSEPPFMHHGRATTVTEAILMHGGEGEASRNAFAALGAADQEAVIAFLKTLRVLPEEAETRELVEPFNGFVGEQPAVTLHAAQAAIDAGSYSAEKLFAIGRDIFQASFNALDGQGRPESTGTGMPRARREAPQNFNRLSGPDANACSGCHNLPDSGGGGDNVANVFVLAQALPFVNFDGGEGDGFQSLTLDGVGNERNTLGMWGSGFIELLAREMTVELQAQRAQGLAAAAQQGAPVTVALAAKGVSFGSLVAQPNGMVDAALVQGVDSSLIVKPFHQKGVVVSLREFTNNAMNHHHGIQPRERFGAGIDADNDGVADEMGEGDITAVTLYQAMLRVPGRVLPAAAARRAAVDTGESLFAASLAAGGLGCAECHVPSLVLNDPVFTEPGPFNPPGNLTPAQVAQPFAVDLTIFGPAPRLAREANGTVVVPAYTDLKRHDMGPENAEPLVQAMVSTSQFITRKLWGFASEPPFWHNGRAMTIDEAIRLHGGEGAASRDAYLGLSATQRHCVVDFLRTLQVVPVNSPPVVTE